MTDEVSESDREAFRQHQAAHASFWGGTLEEDRAAYLRWAAHSAEQSPQVWTPAPEDRVEVLSDMLRRMAARTFDLRVELRESRETERFATNHIDAWQREVHMRDGAIAAKDAMLDKLLALVAEPRALPVESAPDDRDTEIDRLARSLRAARATPGEWVPVWADEALDVTSGEAGLVESMDVDDDPWAKLYADDLRVLVDAVLGRRTFAMPVIPISVSTVVDARVDVWVRTTRPPMWMRRPDGLMADEKSLIAEYGPLRAELVRDV